MNIHKYDNRKYLIGAMAVLVAVVYLVRLFSIQLLDHGYKDAADSNALYHKTIYPMRGALMDRNGKLIVSNQPSYDIIVTMRSVHDLDTLAFCQSLGITKETFDSRMADVKNLRRNPGYSSWTRQVFMSQLSAADVSDLKQNLYMFDGFEIDNRTIRRYEYAAGAHMLGDLGEVSKADIEQDPYYSKGDFIGKQGVEKYYEKELRGSKGVEVLLRDAHGRIQGHYNDGELDVEAVAGKDLKLSVDIDLQMLGEKLMQNKIGSIVAIEPATGEILCMVSSPTYDPSLLTGRHRGENYTELAARSDKPLLNRPIQGTYPPGSTFKTSQALTFLQEGIIDQNTMFPCTNGFVFGRLKVGCHSHSSPLPLLPAIATSCNGYFCWGYYRMIGASKYGSPQAALTVWKDYMVDMGFGYALGVDLPGEARGMIPNADYYDRHYRRSWNGLTTISNAIGQGEVTLTPLQIANLGATIANRGFYIKPHVLRNVDDQHPDSIYLEKHYVGVDRKNYEIVVNGMRQAVLEGTCRVANNPDYMVCGKTGTAENRGKDHSVFMGFAPMDNPRIAISVYVENGGFGASYGVPIGALMMEQYIKGGLSEESMAAADEMSQRKIDYGKERR
ncbi:MAG: penicillin-binding protein 2 [Bacteroidaceae bacterium]|nr:penicillin-binding protein 2 [Bacteroidaceae bacterium]